MSKNLKSTSGFTIIEVLLATIIMATMLLLMGTAFRSSAEGNSIVMNKAELLEDVRSAGQMISDYARNAVFVYPPGTNITLQTSAGAGNFSVVNPRTGTNIWTVGTDNIVAFILPPTQGSVGLPGAATLSCEPVATLAVANVTDPSACLTFVAYYVLNRASIVASAGGSDNPGPDPINGTTGMVYEYRLQLPLARLSGTLSTVGNGSLPPTTIGNGANNYNTSPALVADYIEAGTIATNYKFRLSGLSCLANNTNQARFLNAAGTVLPFTIVNGTTKYDIANFTPSCPTIQTVIQQTNGALDSFASVAQATLTISAGRKNNLGQTFTTGDMTFPIAPVNLLIPGT